MKEMRLIEPHCLTRARMIRDRLAALHGAQPIRVFPLAADAGRSAERLDGAAVIGLKHCLPGETQPFAVMANVDTPLTLKALADRRIYSAKHVAAIGNRCFAAFR